MERTLVIFFSFLFACGCYSNDDQGKPTPFAQVEKVFIGDTILGRRISLFMRLENQGEVSDTLIFKKNKSLLNIKGVQTNINSHIFIEDSLNNKVGEFELWGVESNEVILNPESNIKLLFILESEDPRFVKKGGKSENLRIVERFLTENRIIFSFSDKTNRHFSTVVEIPADIEYYYRAAFVDDLE